MDRYKIRRIGLAAAIAAGGLMVLAEGAVIVLCGLKYLGS